MLTAMVERWNPWRALKALTRVTLEWELLPAGVRGLYCPEPDGTATIVLDARLGRVQRNATLAHEVVHAERGIVDLDGCPSTMAVLDWREEVRVDDEVARRLVPLEDLAAVVDSLVDMGLGVEPWQIANTFDVPDRVAERAMVLLQRERAA